MTRHWIRIRKVKSALWRVPGGRAWADAWQWVCACKRVGPERTTRRSADKGGAQHMVAVDRADERTR